MEGPIAKRFVEVLTQNTSDFLGAFKITKEEAVAGGCEELRLF